jgi:protein SCO1
MQMDRRNLITGSALAPLALLPSGAGLRARPTTGRTALPNVALTTHENRRVRFYDDLVRGNRIVIVNFMYAQCGDICPGATANLALLQAALGGRVGHDVFLYSITLAPHQDSTEILAHYAQTFGAGPGWKFLTGRPTDIERLRRALRFVDPDPVLDRDRNQHTGMLRIGNEALDRWIACPTLLKPERLAREVMWVGWRGQA